MADYNYNADTGVIVPDFTDTRQEVEQEYRAIEGFADADLSPESMLGALVTREALQRDNVVRTNAWIANQINPDISTGVFLDALFAFSGGQRFSETHSIVYGVELRGRANTVIQQGSRVSDGANEWQLLQTKVIPMGGVTTGDFQCVTGGKIEASPNTIKTIVTSVLGWEQVTNPTQAQIGQEEETDLQVRKRRLKAIAGQASEAIEAVVSALYLLNDVRSVQPWENYTNNPITVGAITIPPHSLYLCIDGGDPVEIAHTLKRVKGIGAGYYGGSSPVTETIVDTYSGQDYTIEFARPEDVHLKIKVTAKSGILNPESVIPDLVTKWAQGQTETDEGVTVGRAISPFEIAAAINEQEPSLFIAKVEISDDNGGTWKTDTKELEINEIAVIDDVEVVVV